MDPIAQLKQEHNLILRMNNDIEQSIRGFREEGRIDPGYVDAATDFIRTYADRCHHGKEEGILFRELEKKDLDGPMSGLMRELVQEHDWARSATSRLIGANQSYTAGDPDMLDTTLRLLDQIRRFYPGHITKEESRFFNRCLEYFSAEEVEDMSIEFAEFDRGLIHTRYEKLVAGLEGS